MNRRQFLAGSAVIAAAMPALRLSALDVDIVKSPIIELLRMMPDVPTPNGHSFPATTAMNHIIQKQVWPENPDKYWDPEGEDYHTVLGLYPNWIQVGADQAGASLWYMDIDSYDRQITYETLESNGWQLVDEELTILQFAGSAELHAEIGISLNMLGQRFAEGIWDWVALPDQRTVIVGSDGELVRTIADRVLHHTVMTTVESHFHQLPYVLRTDTYVMTLVPPQMLPVRGAEAAFISRSWTGDLPVIQSIGVRLATMEEIDGVLTDFERRLRSEISGITGLPYADFLSINGSQSHGSAVRIDLVDASKSWDIREALSVDDLNMLPPPAEPK